MAHPKATVKHATSKRVRIHVPSKQHDRGYFEHVKRKLSENERVVSVETNEHTGTILVKHESDLEGIRAFAEEHGLFTLALASEAAIALAHRMSGHMESLDDTLIRTTRGNMDLNSVMLVGLLGATAIQVLRKNVLPPASTLIWYALALIWPKRGPHHE